MQAKIITPQLYGQISHMPQSFTYLFEHRGPHIQKTWESPGHLIVKTVGGNKIANIVVTLHCSVLLLM
jgi:hypothetical protein